MPKPRNEVTRKKNAEIVVNTLRFLQCATLKDIVQYIAAFYQVDPEDIKESVKIILHKGVRYAYVDKRGTKYSINGFFSSCAFDYFTIYKPQKKIKRLLERIGRRKKRG